MPLFSYHCDTCDSSVELLLRGSEEPACPSCGTTSLEKELSHFAAMTAGTSRPAPMDCGATSCCRMQGGCGMN